MRQTGESVGVDFGLKTFLTISTGEKIEAPQFYKHSLKQLRKLNKSVSRKVNTLPSNPHALACGM